MFVFCLGAAAEPKLKDLGAQDFVFNRFNRDYRDLDPKMGEIQSGPLVIQLSSPKQVILIRGHRLSVQPAGDGRHRARLEIEFEGSGDVSADITLIGFKTRLSDRFWMPRQKKVIEGEIHVKRTEAGYRLTPLKLPKAIEIRIRTGLGNRVVDWCNSMAWLSASLIDCQDLDRALSTPSLPLDPKAVLLIVDDDLLPEERAELDRYLRLQNAR